MRSESPQNHTPSDSFPTRPQLKNDDTTRLSKRQRLSVRIDRHLISQLGSWILYVQHPRYSKEFLGFLKIKGKYTILYAQ